MRVLFFLLTIAALAALGDPFCGTAPAAEKISPKEFQRDYPRLRQQRFYRHGSAVLDNVMRFSQMDEGQMTPPDRFLRAFYEGRWDEVRKTMGEFPEGLASVVYDKMLDDLTGRNVPVLTLEDCLGLADACPGEFTTERIRRLGQLLRVAVPADQELWLKRALDKGTHRLGHDDAKRLTTGRILLHADFGDLARQYLPPLAEIDKITDQAVRDEIANFLTGHEQTEESQQAKIAGTWKEKTGVLADPRADAGLKQRATDDLVDLLGKAPTVLLEPWIGDLMRDHPAAGLQLASALGKIAANKGSDSDAAARTNNLRVQKTLLRCAAQHTELAKVPWNAVAVAMADWWAREAEHSFQHHYKGSKPHVPPTDILDTAPDGAWVKALPGSLQERIDMCLSKAVLVSDRYEEAIPLIVQIAKRNPKAAASLAEEYLKAWAERHNPQIPEEVRKRHQLSDDARIAVTPIMMEKNIDALAKMMGIFRQQGIHPRNGQLLVAAFDVCYSNAEAYRRGHVEKVFGPVEEMDEDIFVHMIRTMTEGLSSRWRKAEVQKESGTRRTHEETLRMVREGYQAAIDMIGQRTQKHPDSWRTLMLAGSLLSDWADFEYYQELAAETKTRRMEAFREKNNQAEEYFTRAAEAYARRLSKLGRGGQTIDVYLAWFHSLLGINTNGDLNLAKPLDRRGLGKLRDMIRGLPGETAKTHIDKFAKYVNTRLEDTDHPLHEDLKYKYLAGSLVITKESPFSFEANSKVDYYDELLSELHLETRVDGPSAIHRDQSFGIILSVQHTEAVGRMADFGKYLVNETPPVVPAWQQPKKKVQQPVVTVYKMGEIHGRRDQLEMNIREALSLFFDIKSITFSPRDVQPRPTERTGWKETVLAYIHAKAKDSSVDKIPRVQMSIEFLDLTGPVTISAESPETMIRVNDQKAPPRPFHRVDLTQVLDGRNLASTEEVLLEITATSGGLVPELDDLLDIDALRKQLPIARIDPHEGAQVREINSWGDKVHAVSQRRWTVALDASSLLKPPRRVQLRLPALKTADAVVKHQAYIDMDLVDLPEPVALVGQGAVEEVADAASPLTPWVPYAAVAGGIVGLLVLGLLVARLTRGRGERAPRARDVFHMPGRIDPFVVIQLLRSLGGSSLVRLSEAQRTQMREEIDRIQATCFGNGSSLPEEELRGIARKWLKTAR